MHPILFSRIVDRRHRGEKIEWVDLTTRTTRTSQHAQRVLMFKPQTDLAIANCVMKLLLDRGTYDKKFVEKHCAFRIDSDPPGLLGKESSFEEFKKNLQKYTPEYVEELSGVPASELEHLADLFGDPKIRITSLWCMGANQHTQGTALNTLIHGLHLLSGHFGKPGDAPTSLTGQPSACGTAREVGTLAHALPGGRLVAKEPHREQCEEFWNLPKGRINAKPGFHTVKMWESFSSPKDKGGDISTIWVQVTNPGQTLPNAHKLFHASRKLKDKFLIVSDVYPTATTKYADLILPSSMWVEKNGVFGNSERRTQQWFKQVDPPGEARDDCWQTIAVARELYDRGVEGMKDKDGKFLFHMEENGKVVETWKWRNYYDMNVDKALFEEYRPFTRMKHKDLAPYDEYVKAHGLRWPVVEQKDGTWRETRFRFSEFDDPYVKKGNEYEFYHSTSKNGRAQIWSRPYVAPPEVPDKDFPLWLCTGRVIEHWHSGSMTMRIPQLRKAMPNAYVEMNREDANKAGLNNGDVALLETRRGALRLPVWIDGRGNPPPGSVFVPFFDERLLINELTLDAHDRFSKQPDYKKCAARIRKARGKKG
jgi:nitrate reductase NapA